MLIIYIMGIWESPGFIGLTSTFTRLWYVLGPGYC
ncbi:MAG: hypothetical protein JWP78_714 [Mucilaginibacter sp.]|nr:hypothetical protein [Mucilaginibacter sp.]